jgi:Allene oxide cyclase barrel like domain
VRTHLKHYPAVLAVVALGVLVFGTGVAAAHGDRGETLRLVAVDTVEEFIDVGVSGPSLGDEFVFSETLRKDRRDVGRSGGVCTITRGVPPYDIVDLQCVVTLSLRGGQITLQGLNEVQGEDDPGPFTLAITGGTGKYRGASGEATFRRRSEDRGVYRLRFDKGNKKHHSRGHHRGR